MTGARMCFLAKKIAPARQPRQHAKGFGRSLVQSNTIEIKTLEIHEFQRIGILFQNADFGELTDLFKAFFSARIFLLFFRLSFFLSQSGPYWGHIAQLQARGDPTPAIKIAPGQMCCLG